MLVPLTFLFRMLLAVIIREQVPFHIYIPHPSLKEEYRQRYIRRGNNARFIFEVMFIWYLSLIPIVLLSKVFPQWITVTKKGETLSDYKLGEINCKNKYKFY